MPDKRPPAPSPRLKVRIPFLFEAEGEGLAPVWCVAGLAALFVVCAMLARFL